MSDLTHSESILIAASPEAVYDLVSDITRTGEWSPVCQECWWDSGATGAVGDLFTGRNVLPDRTWETRCTVFAADLGREFGWLVGDSLVRWLYSMEAEGEGTRLTEAWEFLPNGIALFHDRYGEDAETQIANRTELAHRGIAETLAAMKRIAESR
ncbi:SRPBCC family protein [Sporichthya sp.]|uniref:SRPBCC family protein n=1 Tax=Sporichthya sp. TaxID=65475 RepID=UPI00184E3084|nr:SRPBCC family protein [Sporichthya sp.]MBA3744961.1 SRPBCC family protein [Sporichthya sp.]